MGLKSDITADIAAAFDTDLADAVSTVTATHYTDTQTDFDPATGKATRTGIEFTLRGVMMEVTLEDVNLLGAIPGSQKYLVLEEEMAATNQVLQINDTLIYLGALYTVYQVEIDPADTTHTFFIKAENP